MSVIRAGDYEFHQYNVAFHFERDNPYSPWRTIGVYCFHPTVQIARYLPGYESIIEAVDKELAKIDSEYIRASADFLDWWRKEISTPLSAISPVINYCTTAQDCVGVSHSLFKTYVGNNSTNCFGKIAIMLQKRERYFPILFRSGETGRSAKRVLEEAQLI